MLPGEHETSPFVQLPISLIGYIITLRAVKNWFNTRPTVFRRYR